VREVLIDIEKQFEKWKEREFFARVKRVGMNKLQEASQFLTAALAASRR